MSKNPKVPSHVMFEMQKNIEHHAVDKQRRREIVDDMGNPHPTQEEELLDIDEGGDDEPPQARRRLQKEPVSSTHSTSSKPRRPYPGCGLEDYFSPKTTPGFQPTIKSVLAKDKAKEQATTCSLRDELSLHLI
ncbi:hypothetical protein AMTR_s00017p00247310 [Amborella trichopoda]|uniref:Uncharacterized protein n=1 Tax=Amborella trichopoda TaxID=13333 RepID=W1PLX6_AMBTC|nr:hypothetical protein AMTR_s00017p00247310 [Amborella trichopoda]